MTQYKIKVEPKKGYLLRDGKYSYSSRIVIPAEAAKSMGIIPGQSDILEAELDPDTGVLKLWKGKGE